MIHSRSSTQPSPAHSLGGPAYCPLRMLALPQSYQPATLYTLSCPSILSPLVNQGSAGSLLPLISIAEISFLHTLSSIDNEFHADKNNISLLIQVKSSLTISFYKVGGHVPLSSAQGLLQALSSVITPYRTQGTTWGAGE